MENNNGSKIHGKRKLIAALIFACGGLFSSSLLCYNGKISGKEYNAGLSSSGLAVMVYLGANAAQKFSKGGK